MENLSLLPKIGDGLPLTCLALKPRCAQSACFRRKHCFHLFNHKLPMFRRSNLERNLQRAAAAPDGLRSRALLPGNGSGPWSTSRALPSCRRLKQSYLGSRPAFSAGRFRTNIFNRQALLVFPLQRDACVVPAPRGVFLISFKPTCARGFVIGRNFDTARITFEESLQVKSRHQRSRCARSLPLL